MLIVTQQIWCGRYLDPAVVGKLFCFHILLVINKSTMSSTPPTTSSASFLASLNIADDASRSPVAAPSAAPQGEFQSLTLGIASPAGTKGGKGVTDGNSIQVLPGIALGVGVAHILQPEELCCGLIGNSGTKFCIQSKDCTTSTHVLPMRKHQTTPGLYILDKRTGGCLINPVLDSSNLDDSVVNRILETDAEPEELRNEFILLASQDGTKDSDIDSFARKNFLKTVAFKTPSKGQSEGLGSSQSNLVDIVSNFTAKSETEGVSSSIKFESNEELSRVVSELEQYYDGLRRILPSVAGTVDSLEFDIKEKTNLIYGSLQQLRQLEGVIGKQPQVLKEQNTAPTIWGTVSELFSTQQKYEVDSNTKLESFKGVLNQFNTKLNQSSTKTDSDNLKNDIFNLLKGWKSIIEEINTKVSKLEAMNSSGSSSSNNSSNAFNALGIAGMNQTTTPDQSNVNPSESLSSSMSDLLNALTSRLGKLERQYSEKGKEGLNGAVRFSGVTFTGKDDVGAWLDASLPNTGGVPPYGLFADPQLLLHWVWILLSGTTNSSARDMKDRISIEMSQDKTYAVDSYQHYIPLVFTGKKSSLLNTGGMEKSRLAQIPSFESWDDATGEAGLKQQIAEGLSMVKDSISDLIEENFGEAPEVRAFALSMLHTSVSFIQSLGTYMSETYNNFKDVVGNEKSVWGLVTFVVEQLFRKDFGQVRAKTIGAIDANNRTSGVKIIWSSIKCVDVAQQFMLQGIKNAPSVSASYVRFVITHSNMGKVSNILEDNKKLKRKIDDLETSLVSIKKMAEGAKKVADQAMSKAGSSTVKKKKKTESGEGPATSEN
jgi:hypothetical protein